MYSHFELTKRLLGQTGGQKQNNSTKTFNRVPSGGGYRLFSGAARAHSVGCVTHSC